MRLTAPASRDPRLVSVARSSRRMAPASLDMNSAGLRARGGGGAGPSPLTFSVESLLEAERGLGSKTQEPGEERPQGAAEPGAWLPPVARACPPRKCPASRSRALRGALPDRLGRLGREGRCRS